MADSQLRLQLKRTRRLLSPETLSTSSDQICRNIIHSGRLQHVQHMAGYLSARGEVDPLLLLHYAHQHGIKCYLPVLHPFLKGRLWFAPWHPDVDYQLNIYGIAEPRFNPKQCRSPQWLDLVLTPLLGFDKTCNRLGMGGGYYDRTFAFKRFRQHLNKPHLLGLAHTFQEVDKLTPQPWDVPLDSVITTQYCLVRQTQA